jgi:hypothetical protein
MFATEGKDAETVAAFADDLTAHGGKSDAVSEICIDMSPMFIKGTAASLPKANSDKFHAAKIIDDAVDQVCRAEQKCHSMLCGTRDLWLHNPTNLPDRQRGDSGKPAHAPAQDRVGLSDPANLSGTRDQLSAEAGASYLWTWYFWATHSRLSPMIDAARAVRRNRDGILCWVDSKIANGPIEGIDSLMHAAKAKGYGSIALAGTSRHWSIEATNKVGSGECEALIAGVLIAIDGENSCVTRFNYRFSPHGSAFGAAHEEMRCGRRHIVALPNKWDQSWCGVCVPLIVWEGPAEQVLLIEYSPNLQSAMAQYYCQHRRGIELQQSTQQSDFLGEIEGISDECVRSPPH